MKTAWQTTHTHTVQGRATTATGGHSHDLAEVVAAIAALDARLDALEGAAPPPPVEPPPAPPPIPPPTPPPPAGNSVRVTSIPALKTALVNDTLDEIIVANGTYALAPSNRELANSLWIGGNAFVARTRPITVRAETKGGVIFDGGGLSAFGAISFEDGAHHQTWDGFTFANMLARETGIIEFGGYVPRRTPHHITVRNMTVLSSCQGRATTADGSTWDHAIYIAHAAGEGPNNILIEDLTVDGRGFLACAVHFDHGDAVNPAAHDVTCRRLTVTATQQAILLWRPTLRNITFDGATITGAKAYGVRYESQGGTAIRFANITSTGSGYRGFYSEQGANPPGVTIESCDFR